MNTSFQLLLYIMKVASIHIVLVESLNVCKQKPTLIDAPLCFISERTTMSGPIRFKEFSTEIAQCDKLN